MLEKQRIREAQHQAEIQKEKDLAEQREKERQAQIQRAKDFAEQQAREHQNKLKTVAQETADRLAEAWAKKVEVFGYRDAEGEVESQYFNETTKTLQLRIQAEWNCQYGGEPRVGHIKVALHEQRDGSFSQDAPTHYGQNAKLVDIEESLDVANAFIGFINHVNSSPHPSSAPRKRIMRAVPVN